MLAFVTGVPGAGKTYLGLQYVYVSFQAEKQVHSVYLSGNGPLVKVLSSALGSHVFVKDLHKQIDEFVRYQAKDFHQNIIVFDEGQRAWTQERMAQRNPDVYKRQAYVGAHRNSLPKQQSVLDGEGAPTPEPPFGPTILLFRC